MQTHPQVESLSSLETELHHLAQPLAALQCRLEIGQLQADHTTFHETVEGALDDLERVKQVLFRIRELVVSLGER